MMHQEAMDQRFSSCRGVSFEIQPHKDPFAIDAPRASRRSWVPWGSSNKIAPTSGAIISRSNSRASSHFCDLETDDEDDEDDVLINIEEGHELDDKYELPLPVSIPEVLPQAPSKKILSKPTKPKGSRLSVILLDQGLFTVYKRLFMVCLALNITGLALAATGHFPYARNHATLFSIGNLLALTLYVGSRLVKEQEFWFTLVTTILIIIPWVTVRRVAVKVSAPSGHASIIKFAGGVKPGILGRISPSPMSEWHAFGIISDGKEEHMMLAGAVGDFTKSLVSNPPSHLWVRQVHFAGLPYLVNMYNRVLVVATGSGICVFLSFLLQQGPADVCLLWVAKGIEQNFGKEIKEWVSRHPKEKVIVHDTAVMGRPNVSEMSVAAARNFGAEVVIVTSNPEGSRDVVNACKSKGIPAFGPIWDS
ncbi:hypothetical protein Ccrd_008520 [Cynara cardunculus var. scolymus]|uniref:Uncharacterized protein n=1 Tax=Cynara cardunculus var. scolymus TaxID=59895 RepID=A0A103XF30_CYNCS|nr:hypothetical protein Ccrd_008520 [Cynara cardunculus var. scolymus]